MEERAPTAASLSPPPLYRVRLEERLQRRLNITVPQALEISLAIANPSPSPRPPAPLDVSQVYEMWDAVRERPLPLRGVRRQASPPPPTPPQSPAPARRGRLSPLPVTSR